MEEMKSYSRKQVDNIIKKSFDEFFDADSDLRPALEKEVEYQFNRFDNPELYETLVDKREEFIKCAKLVKSELMMDDISITTYDGLDDKFMKIDSEYHLMHVSFNVNIYTDEIDDNTIRYYTTNVLDDIGFVEGKAFNKVWTFYSKFKEYIAMARNIYRGLNDTEKLLFAPDYQAYKPNDN